MMVILGSCSTPAAFILLAAAAWMYFNGRNKPEAERNQPALIGLSGVGMLACLISVAILALYIVGFMNFSQ